MTEKQFVLDNGILRAVFRQTGGEPISLSVHDGENVTELLWNGDEKYWGEHAPLLFPTVGRLRGGSWICRGREFRLGIHGFARFLSPEHIENDKENHSVSFFFRDNPTTAESYPFRFDLCRSFRLDGNKMISRVTVKNTDSVILPFSVGLHPGFILPSDKSRLKLEYSEPPRRLLLSDNFFMSGEAEPYPLRDDRYIDIDNSLFDHDAIILTNVTSVTLESAEFAESSSSQNKKTPHSVRISCPDAATFGFWQPAHTDAPFICIEPWRGLPSFDAPDGTLPDNAMTRPGTNLLHPGEEFTFLCETEIL